ncbi:MAG: ROK family protein [Paracoccaceae bacterium]
MAPERRALHGFAVDLGGTKIAAARIYAGQIAARSGAPTDGGASGEALVAAMGTLLKGLGYVRGDPLGIAVAGRIDAQGLWHAVNLGTLREVSAIPLQGLASALIGDCRCLNDAAAAVLAEARCGAGRGAANLAYVTVSTGIGGGLMVDGRLLSSASGLAGHIGFAGSRLGERLCGSGRSGTVESVAGGRAIAEAAALAGHAMDARGVIQAARAGEAWADAIIGRSARSVAALIADLRAILGLDRAILGGSIGLSEGYLHRVRGALDSEPALFRVPLVTAELGPDAPLFGALANAVGGNAA